MPNAFPSFSINDNDWVRVRQFVQRVSTHDLRGRGSIIPYIGAVSNVNLGSHDLVTLGDFSSPKGIGTIWGNEAFGRNSLNSVTTGDYNTAIGSRALEALTTGHSNTALGRKAGVSLTEGDYNVAIGLQALQNATTANQNVAIGTNALLAVTTGSSNFACGYLAVDSLTEGTHNVGLGSETLSAITTQSYNTAIGSHALGFITAAECTAVGYYAGKTCGACSVSVGNFAGYVIGTNSISIGSRAGYTTTLNNNVFIGHEAGRLNEGSGNIFLGYQAGRAETGSNKLYIQNSSSATPLILGNFAAPTITIHGRLVVNEGGLDYDTRIEGLSDESLLFIDAGNDRVGLGTASPAVKFDIKGQVRVGTPGANTDYDVDFYGTLLATNDRRLHWDANLATLWCGIDNNNITAAYSFISGYSLTVAGGGNIVAGWGHVVSGTCSAVFGKDNKDGAFNYGFLAGYNNETIQAYAFAVGRDNKAAYYSGAIGRGNTASGSYSFSVGYGNLSTGIESMSFGLDNIANHSVAIMIGYGNFSAANYSYCIGNHNEAGFNSAAIGYYNTSTGNYSICLGRSNTSSGEEGVCIGRDNQATATASYCIGLNNVASNVSALSVGTLVTASANSAIAIGKSITNNTADSVMIGISYSLFFGTTTSIRLNDDAQDIDVVIEGDTDTDLFHSDASTDRVGIGMAAPLYKLHVTGEVAVTTNSITLLISEDEITSSSGSVYFGDENLRTTGTGTFNSLIITAPTNTNYLFTTRSTSNTLALQSTVSGNKCTLELYSKDGDGSDEICYRMFAQGTPEDISNYENLDIRYYAGGPYYLIKSAASGTGNVHPIRIYTDTNTDQLVLATDGKVGINTDTPDSQFEVAGESRFGASSTNYAQFAADGELTLNGTARTENGMWLSSDGIKAPGLKPATYVSHGIFGAWSFANAIEANQESVSGTMRIPEKMDRTVVPTMKIAWSANQYPGACKWQLEYLWTAEGEDTTAAAQDTITVVSNSHGSVNALSIANIVLPSPIAAPSSTDICFHFRITRLSADAQDTITITTELLGVCLNFTSNKLGTAK